MAQKKIKFNFTIFIYLVILFAIGSTIVIASRKVLFRPWTARTSAASAEYSGRMYLFGGVDADRTPRDEILMFDLDKPALYRLGKLPRPLYSATAAAFEGKIYVAGGLSNKQYLDSVYCFDPVEETVQLAGSLPGPRAFGSMAAAGGGLYYFGGFDGEQLRDEIIRIDPATGEAAVVLNTPEPIEYQRTVVLDNKIYIIGGENDKNENIASVYVYSPEENMLTRLNDLSAPRSRFAAAADEENDSIIIAGGWGNSRLNDFIKLKFTDGYTEEPIAGLPEPFSDIDLAIRGDYLYLIGGIEPKYKRQIRVIRINPRTRRHEDVILKSWAWQ